MRVAFQALARTARIRRILATVFVTLASLVCLRTAAIAANADSYVFDTYTAYSTFTKGAPLADSFYYADDWFLEVPEERNDELALMSMQLVSAAFKEDSNGNAASVLSALGFGATGFKAVDDGSLGYAFGTKTLSDGSTLVAVVIQSYPFDSELATLGWQQNFTINGGDSGQVAGEQYSYARVADSALSHVTSLASGQVKYWVCGQSRGGAIANVLAQRLTSTTGADVYAYTFESPATVDAAYATGSYPNIHNYFSADDIVTKVPMWGMTRYGVVHELATGKDDEVVEELTKLGSDAVEAGVNDFVEGTDALVAYLEAKVGTRANYSATQTDTIAGETLAYSYQDTFRNLISFIFSGDLDGLSLDSAMDHVDDLVAGMEPLAEAVAADNAGNIDGANVRYWESAQALRSVLCTILGTDSVGLSETDLYVLLKLAGPFAIDASYQPEGEALSDLICYLLPALDTVMNAESMTFSHQFETVIARLKLLAPQPSLDDIDITIEDPVADDAASKAPADVAASIGSLESPWLSVEAEWETSDETLQNGTVYYLNVTLRAVAHLVPDGFAITINGEDPISALDMSYEEGASVVSGTWVFTIGEPEDVTVSFDALGYADNPMDIAIAKGTLLKNVTAPEMPETVEKDGASYRFGGWYAEDGTAWDSLKATGDMTVFANWKLVIDDVQIEFEPPKLGGTFTAPTVPEDAPYVVEDWYVYDPDWSVVETAETEGMYQLSVSISLKDPTTSVFDLDVEDYGDWVNCIYLGSATLNGEDIEMSYDEDGFYLSGDYRFPVPEDWVAPALYEFVEGDGQTWTKGSADPAVFRVINTEFDEDAWYYFEGVEVDGNALERDTDYTAEEGSVIITLNADYLETLDEGEHTLTANFGNDDEGADATFTVVAPGDDTTPDDTKPADTTTDSTKPVSDGRSGNTPRTGDESQAAWAVPAVCALAVLLGGAVLRRRELLA